MTPVITKDSLRAFTEFRALLQIGLKSENWTGGLLHPPASSGTSLMGIIGGELAVRLTDEKANHG